MGCTGASVVWDVGCAEDPHPNPLPRGEGARAAPISKSRRGFAEVSSERVKSAAPRGGWSPSVGAGVGNGVGSERHGFRSRRGLVLGPVFSEQGSEAGLFEVAVEGQCVGDIALLHDKKAGAVGEAPTLVRARRVSGYGGPELGVFLRGFSETRGWLPGRPLTPGSRPGQALTLSPRRGIKTGVKGGVGCC